MPTEGASKPLLLVTGSSGLIGTLVVKEFAHHFTVVGIDLNPPEQNAGVDFIKSDLTSDEEPPVLSPKCGRSTAIRSRA